MARDASAITSEELDRLQQTHRGLQWPMIVSAAVFGIGIIAFIVRALTFGFGQRAGWGYLAAAFVFLLTTLEAAPVLVIGLYVVKADWRRQISRSATLFAVAGLIGLLLYIPLVATLPPTAGRNSLWASWPLAPWLWDGIALLMLITLGLLMLYVSAIPDLAAARDHMHSSERRRHEQLTIRWRGTSRQWQVQGRAFALFGILLMMMVVFVNLLIPTDFAMSLVPGWKSSVFPAMSLLSGLQSATALNLIALYLWRRLGGLDRYIWVDHFKALSKVLLALTLLWFYLWWSDFLTRWYGRTPGEQNLLRLLDFGPYFVPWLIALIFGFLLPFVALIQARVRASFLPPTLIAVCVLIGSFFDKVRLYVAAFSVETSTGRELTQVPSTQFPDTLDVLMVLGAFSGAALLYFAAARIVPAVAIWELKEELLLRFRRPFLRGEYTVLGKPH